MKAGNHADGQEQDVGEEEAGEEGPQVGHQVEGGDRARQVGDGGRLTVLPHHLPHPPHTALGQHLHGSKKRSKWFSNWFIS